MFPIFIPSKERADLRGHTIDATALHIPYIVVERQDYYAYSANRSSKILVTLPENDRGLAYSRQWILDFARQLKMRWYWQLDDNITGFFRRIPGDGKSYNTHFWMEPCTFAEAASYAESLIDSIPKLAMITLDYFGGCIFADPKTGPTIRNAGMHSAVLTRTDTGIDYLDGTEVEDFVFTLDHLVAGWQTLKVQCYGIGKPRGGTMPGGAHKSYENGRIKEWVPTLLARYPGITFETNDTYGINAHWEKFQ